MQKDEVIVYTKQCNRCRQIFVTPTFSPQEMDRLYSEEGNSKLNEFYKQAENNSGLSYYTDYSGEEERGSKYNQENIMFRCKFIHDVVTSYNKAPINKLLDIGGRDGSNIILFKNAEKYVYDLVKPSGGYSEIEYINDLHTVQSLAPFDLLVSTHTLEHIIHLREALKSYTDLIKPGSLFYIEVPVEYDRIFVKHLLYPLLKKGTHINWHVNYFSPGSLQSLFALSGYKILYLNSRILPYGTSRMQVIIGLFEYTGISTNYYPSITRWYKDFFNNIILDIKLKGLKLFFRHQPSLAPLM